MPLLDGPSLGGNARHVLRQYAEENALARGRAANAAGTEEFGGGCLRGRYNNLREVIQNNPSLVVVPSIINAGSLFVQRPICRTNYLPNNSMAGATGGVLPTNWSIASLPAGITVSYSASGTAVAADGTSVNYIDVTVSGTAGASGFLNIRPNPSPSTIAAFVGQSWNTSVYLQLISGSVASISPTWQLQELNSSQTFLQGSNIGGLGSLVVGGQFDRYNVSRVLTDSATAFVTCRWGHSFVSGTTYSYTLRIGSPQLERFSVPTPMIATSTGAVTRLNESTNVVGLPPDFTVSRNTGATRVGPNGLIEAGNTNLALHSQAFDVSGTWTPTNITVSGNVTGTTDPAGGNTADQIFETAVNGIHFLAQTMAIVSGTTYAGSVFLKKAAGSPDWMQVAFSTTGLAGFANFNLTSGTVGLTGAGCTGRIDNYGNGWYRCTLIQTATASGTSGGPVIVFTNNTNPITRFVNYTGNTSTSIYAWGAQLEVGSTASEYIPTTTVARTRFAGVTVDGTIAANIPRIDWLGQSCPGLLVEASGQNVLSYSEEFDNAVWAKSGMTVSTGTTAAFTAPDGTTNADKIIATTASGVAHAIQRSGLASAAYTFSVFAKAGEESVISLWLRNNAVRAEFNLVSGTISNITVTSAKIENYGNGWYRCSVYDSTAGTTASVYGRGGGAYTGNGVDGFYLWGAQVEANSIPTSYIPTTSGTVSRAADVISASGALVSGLIGQTEGTIYAEVDLRTLPSVGIILSINTGNAVDRIEIYTTSNGKVNFDRLATTESGSTSAASNSTYSVNSILKIAIGYKSGDTIMYINGVAETSQQTATFTFATIFRVNIGSGRFNTSLFNNRIRAAALYTTRLSNAQLAELTRL